VVATSLIYRNSLLYEAVMALLYGRHYFARYRALAGLLPPQARVLDLACGPATLYYRYLRHRGVHYTGLDLNARFIRQLVRRGGHGEVWDLRSDRPLPAADYVIMQASLYHFLPDPALVVERMLAAASHQVIIAEPVRNLANSKLGFLAALARRLTNPGSGRPAERFTEATLDVFMARWARQVQDAFLIPGGREKIYVLAGQRRPQAVCSG
jgi:SAM-dependent methyltransferase